MATPDQLAEEEAAGREAYAGVLRFYDLAKRQEWQTRDLPWGELPPIPETRGSAQRRARRNDMWRSVLTQQLQADMLACDMSAQLLNIAPDHEAKLYYSTMVQDESRHTEAWLKLIGEVGGTAERDPYLDELAHMTLEADTLEEKVFQMQVAYERVLLQSASKKLKQRLVESANRLLPTFVAHALWRPRERAWIGGAMRTRDLERLREDLDQGVRLAQSLGLDVSGVELPQP